MNKLLRLLILTLLLASSIAHANHFGLFFGTKPKYLSTFTDGVHRWNDNSLANSCLSYLNGDARHKYSVATGSGVYRIIPTGYTNSVDVFCDMQNNGGGWTLFPLSAYGNTTYFNPNTYTTIKNVVTFYMFDGSSVRYEPVSAVDGRNLTYSTDGYYTTVTFETPVYQGTTNGIHYNAGTYSFSNCDSNNSSYIRLNNARASDSNINIDGQGLVNNLWNYGGGAGFSPGLGYFSQGGLYFGGCGVAESSNNWAARGFSYGAWGYK